MVRYYSTIILLLILLATLLVILFAREALASVWIIFGFSMILVQVLTGYTFIGMFSTSPLSRTKNPRSFWSSVMVTSAIFIYFYFKMILGS